MKVLVAILNKDNACGLRKTLESLIKQSATVCTDFDVLVVDGGSGDDSYDVVMQFNRDYPCIRFITQSVKGGTGPARVEVCDYVLRNGYDVVIWGDSENVYDAKYVELLLSKLSSGQCDIASGNSVIRLNSLWSAMFYWYHMLHTLPVINRYHAPGNNKGEKALICRESGYLPLRRSEDYFFTLMNFGKYRVCYERNAEVVVNLPKTLRDVIRWQINRVNGLVQGLLTTKLFPKDIIFWITYITLITLLPITYALYNVITAFTAWLAILVLTLTSLEYLAIRGLRPYKPLTSVPGLIGLVAYGLFNLTIIPKLVKVLKVRNAVNKYGVTNL